MTENVHGLTLSPDGAYLAATTEKGVALLETSGQLLWEQDYSAISRWIRSNEYPDYIVPVVVAPRGRWLAVAGNSGYRYVWLLDKQGCKRGYVKTTGTPQALAVTHKGDLLAIGTATGHIYLVSPRGKVLADVRFGGVIGVGPVGHLRGLTFSDDDAYLLLTQGIAAGRGVVGGHAVWMGNAVGVLSRASHKVMWERGEEVATLSMSRDLRWGVVVEGPMHGPPLRKLELISRRGESLWEKELPDAEALISPDGSYIVAKSFDETTEAKPRLLILDRQGNMLLERAEGGSPVLISRDGRYFIIKHEYYGELTYLYWTCHERNGEVVWQLNGSPFDGSAMVSTPDLRLVVVSDGKVVRAYAPPGVKEDGQKRSVAHQSER